MRLIDADDLIKNGFEVHTKEFGTVWVVGVDAIEAQPTAYDVEKVVAELESRKELLNIAKMPNTQKNVGQNAYNIAIDIVKAGGVE